MPYAGALPVQFIENDASVAAVMGSAVADWARIPQAIRDEMCQWWVNAGTLTRFGYRVGRSDWYTQGEGYWPGAEPNRGMYESPIPTDVRMTSGRVLLASTRIPDGGSVVHEFGHHIDQALRVIRGIDSVQLPNSALRFHAPFSTVWQTVSPNIPAALYGATNILEWIAEQWRCIIYGDSVTLLQLMGGDTTARDTMRAEWVRLFPSLASF
ncbi:MAG: hypothetical protein IJO71_11455 [Microbacterium sp.]|uniref:hypothetical protein n=1 Tax=Microbacterium sp. TaxID=51671 RepID=UPI0025F271B8|nr:hypothetical protein [Microbacterium sp.]MBQ9917800.1 hypothetical protein [Microbacterium sp.]